MPAGQGVQLEEPGDDEKEPAEQLLQLAEPVVGEKEPAGHMVHDVTVDVPTLKVPTGQAWQSPVLVFKNVPGSVHTE